MNKLHRLIGDIRYELHNGIHTMGACSRCKKHAARGSGVCVHCRLEELEELVGEDLTNDFYLYTITTNGLISQMDEKAKVYDGNNTQCKDCKHYEHSE